MVQKPVQQRVQVQPDTITWIKAHPKTTFTLAEITNETGHQSSSLSAAIYKIAERETLPGLEIVGRGIYRYDPDAVVQPNSKPEPEAPKRFTLVGNIDRKAVVLADSDGNLWRAERLR